MIESLLSVAPERARASFYRTARGAEIDLLLEFGGRRGTWAIEVKRGRTAKVEKGLPYRIGRPGTRQGGSPAAQGVLDQGREGTDDSRTHGG